MVSNMMQLRLKMERLRKKMVKLAEKQGLSDKGVLVLSNKLDGLMNEYLGMKRQKLCRSCVQDNQFFVIERCVDEQPNR